MSKELNDKFNLQSWTIPNKGKLIIKLPARVFPKFLELVSPYIHPHMKYKLPKGDSRH
jgi:hypothetical protein